MNEQAQIHSDLHDGLGTSQHQSCSLPFTHVTISPSTSSVWIHIALPPPSWPIPQHPHHPDQTPSLSPGITNVVLQQIQVCQCRVLLQSLCQCLTANKDVQNTWWNHLRFFEIYIQEISTPSTACSHTSSDIHMSCGLQWNEKNKLKFTQIWIMDLAHLSTNPLCSLPFTHFTISPSTSSVWIHSALPPPPHDRFLSIFTILTKHQAWAPSGPALFLSKFRFVRVEFCFSPSANAWQQTKMCKIRGEII